MAKKGIAATGTVAANRVGQVSHKAMIPLAEFEKKQRGYLESSLDEQNEVCLVRWKDKKVVTLMSTYVGAYPVGVITN